MSQRMYHFKRVRTASKKFFSTKLNYFLPLCDSSFIELFYKGKTFELSVVENQTQYNGKIMDLIKRNKSLN